MQTWTVRKSGNYGSLGVLSQGSQFAVQSITAASKQVVVTGDASALQGQNITLYGTTASDGNYTVSTAVHTTTTLLTLISGAGLVNQGGAAGNVYQNGTPVSGDTVNLNGLAVALNVSPANVTIEDLAGGATLTASGVTLTSFTVSTSSIVMSTSGVVTIASGSTVNFGNATTHLNAASTSNVNGTYQGNITIANGTCRLVNNGTLDVSAASVLLAIPTGVLSGSGVHVLADSWDGFTGSIKTSASSGPLQQTYYPGSVLRGG